MLVRHSDLTEQALALCAAPQIVVDVTGCGPNAALQVLRQLLPNDIGNWQLLLNDIGNWQ